MRIIERAQYFCFLIIFCLSQLQERESIAHTILVDLEILALTVGYSIEGVRLAQLPFFLATSLRMFLEFTTNESLELLELVQVSLCLFAIYTIQCFGDNSYDCLNLTGPRQVGYVENTTKKFKNDFSVFYPVSKASRNYAALLPYQEHQVKSREKRQKTWLQKLVLKPLMTIEMPVDKDHKGIPNEGSHCVIFSHGIGESRLQRASLCIELASHGYLVICLSHNDGSADYTPEAGEYREAPEYHQQIRKMQQDIRSNEIKELIKEIKASKEMPKATGFSLIC